MSLWDVDNKWRLKYRGQVEFLMDKNRNHGLVGTPDRFTVVGPTSETPPRPQLEFGIEAPDAIRLYRLWYYKRPAMPTSDAAYPIWPEAFEDMLWMRAAIEWMSSARYFHKHLMVYQQKYADMLWRMRQQLDGDSAIDREVRSVFLGDRVFPEDFEFNYRVV